MDHTFAEKTYLRRKEAAQYLNVSVRHLDNLVELGDIPSYRPGRVVLLKREDIDKYVEGTEVQQMWKARYEQ